MSYVDLGLCSVVACLSVAAATIVCCKHIRSSNPPHYYSIAPLHASAVQASAAHASAVQAQAQAQAQVVIVDAPKYESYQNCPPMYEEGSKPHI